MTPSPKVFVLILHGYTIKVSNYNSLQEAVLETFRGAKVSVPELHLTTFSSADPAEITATALAEVDQFWDGLKEEEKSDAKIILVGHSTGALFARKAFVVAFGESLGDSPDEVQISSIRPWAKNIDRIILLAGINNGWTLGGHLDWFILLKFRIGIGLGKLITSGDKKPIAFHTRRGSEFIAELNRQTARVIEKTKDFLVIQILGIEDKIVSPEDTVDFINGSEYVYLEMDNSNHTNLIEFCNEDGKQRKALFTLTLTENKHYLQQLQQFSLSLPLRTVLHEEFAHLYSVEQPVEQEVTLQFKSYGEYREIIAKINDLNRVEHSISDYEKYRLKNLKYWADKQRVMGEPLSTRHLSKSLNLQLKTRNLLLNETWIEEAALRPYTRGLVINYKKLIKKEKDQGLFWSSITDKSSNIIRYYNAYKHINRLVLEDVYGDILEKNDDVELRAHYKAQFEQQANALCLSGGGIRSGTFALGVLQGLANSNQTVTGNGKVGSIFEKIHYLSTVSGGGYIGGWLSAWLNQEEADQVFSALSGKSATLQEPAPLRYLRQYSNFLTPLVGLFSADTWTLFATYLRNMLLNWLIIIPFLAAFVTLPWLTTTILNFNANWLWISFGFVLGGAALIYSDYYTKKNPPTLLKKTRKKAETDYRKRPDQIAFLLKCLLPGSFGFLIWAISWYWLNKLYFTPPFTPSLFHKYPWSTNYHYWSFHYPTIWQYLFVAGASGLFVLIEWGIFRVLESKGKIPKRFEDSTSKRVLDAGLLTFGGVFYGAVLVFLFSKIPIDAFSPTNLILYSSIAFPIFILIQLVIGFLYEGLKSDFAEDAEREWRARYSGWFLIVALVWLVISALTLCVPLYLENNVHFVISFSAITGYLTAYWGNKSVGKGDPVKAKESGNFAKLFSYLTLPVLAFIAFLALLVLISQLDILLLSKLSPLIGKLFLIISKRIPIFIKLAYAIGFDDIQPKASKMIQIFPIIPLLLFGLLSGMGILFSWYIGSNRFSLHAMYRSRLIRAFLGAARPQGVRAPDPFTGFDESDNLYMGSLADVMPTKASDYTLHSNQQQMAEKPFPKRTKKPFHIINIALNLAAGDNLAWQERKAASFTVSPLHAGSGYLGYRNTFLKGVPNHPIPEKSTNYYGGERGISLGTAMTISGAAVSPNRGYNTSTLVAFFMTLFNLRLGSWLGNPGPAGDNSFNETSPKSVLNPIFRELFGMTDDQSDYVNLSDGGHFDNLGLYEMVRRRNRFIVVSDGSCDDKCELEDLGNAIRKIRIDLGVEIDFPLGFNIGARATNLSDKGRYWALGRIRYPENNYESIYKTNVKETFREKDAVLLYIKPGIYGNEPKDIFNYASVNLAFPHESTADQFFSESQFESYRALGMYAVERIKAELMEDYGIHLADMFGPKDWGKEVIDNLNCPKQKHSYSNPNRVPHVNGYRPDNTYPKGRNGRSGVRRS